MTLAARNCSLLKVDPQVLHRHPVMGVRAAFAAFIREGLKDKPSSPPHCKHRCFGKRTSFLSLPVPGRKNPHPPAKTPGWGVRSRLQELNVFGLQAFRAFHDLELYGLAFLEALEAG